MTQTGAMVEDMEYLQKPLFMHLPDDEHKRCVVHWDRIKCVRSVAPRDSVARCIFYTLHALCEREATQKGGFVIIVNFRVSYFINGGWYALTMVTFLTSFVFTGLRSLQAL